MRLPISSSDLHATVVSLVDGRLGIAESIHVTPYKVMVVNLTLHSASRYDLPARPTLELYKLSSCTMIAVVASSRVFLILA